MSPGSAALRLAGASGVRPRRRADLVIDGPTLHLVFDPADRPVLLGEGGPRVVVADRPLHERRPADLRLAFDALAAGRLDGIRPRHVLLHGSEHLRLGPLGAALRLGARTFWFVHSIDHVLEVPRRSVIPVATAFLALRRAPRGRPLGPPSSHHGFGPPALSRRGTRATVRAALRIPPRDPAAGAPSVVHLVGNLGPGGAERQLVHVVRASVEAGARVAVWTQQPLDGALAHHAETVRSTGAEVRSLAAGASLEWPEVRGLDLEPDLLRRHAARCEIGRTVRALENTRPDVLHAWLDLPNAIGGVSGLLARVPRVVLSTRSLAPTHFPALHKTWFRGSYRLLGQGSRVTLLANSRAGAGDYSRWSGLRPDRFRVVPNGIDTAALAPLAPERRRAGRGALGIPEDAFLVVGLFRLGPEKRPLDFVDTLAGLAERVPGLRALHVGGGDDPRAVARAASLGLGERLRFLGRREDPAPILGLADASLLVSEVEGCPNALLESQALGVPVVATRAGGIPEVLTEGSTGALAPVGDVPALVEALEGLARQPDRRAFMGRAARAWVEERFSLERMTRSTLEAYDLEGFP